MRLDLFLKVSRLIARRTVAQELCDAGAVTVNDAAAKNARIVKAGDVIAFAYRGRRIAVRVLFVPAGKGERPPATGFYEALSDERISEP
jgi:ribosomal 50S subunit-recycling heat shock protein